MKKNQLVIDLGKVKLPAAAKKKLTLSLHKAVAKSLKSFMENDGLESVSLAEAAASVATIHVTFSTTEPGLSSVTASLRNQKQTITQTGNISIQGAGPGDIIRIRGNSLGSTTITIDVDADPSQLNFPPGKINGSFFIN